MKFIISSSVLNKALKQVSPAISTNRVIPILENVKFDVKDKQCVLTASNLNLTISITVECEHKEDFSCIIPYKELFKISSLFSGNPLLIEVAESVIVKMDEKKFDLGKREDEINYPEIPSVESKVSFQIDDNFLYNLQLAKKCVSKGEAMYNFNDVFVVIEKNKVDIVGTDSFQMFKNTIELSCSDSVKFAVQPNFIDAIAEITEGILSTDNRFLKVQSKEKTVISTLSENKVPSYSVLFVDHESNFEINKHDLIGAINNVLIFEANFHPLNLNFEEDAVKISYYDYYTGKSFETLVNCKHSVEIEKITLNAEQLKNLLSLLPEHDEVLFFFGDKESQSVYIEAANSKTQLLTRPLMSAVA